MSRPLSLFFKIRVVPLDKLLSLDPQPACTIGAGTSIVQIGFFVVWVLALANRSLSNCAAFLDGGDGGVLQWRVGWDIRMEGNSQYAWQPGVAGQGAAASVFSFFL